MSWLTRYRIRLYVRNSLWILPALSIPCALLAARFLIQIELWMGWTSTVSPETARIIMSTVAGSTFTLLVVVSSAMLLAVQLASAQLTPRIIAMIYRSPHAKLAFAIFVFTFTFSVAVLAFNLKGLLALAQKTNSVIEIVPQVGDFIAEGDPLFRIYESENRLAETEMLNSVAVAEERTLEQDPMFAFRILVDVASKALSPAINDPTTAVLAIDQIHHLLRDIGKRYLAEGLDKDANGRVRLIYRTPDWEDFVQLGTTEIRQYGRDSIQVQRRLRAMLEDLIETLPPQRAPILEKELALLGTSLKRAFPDLDDQVLAESGDLQGIGGSDDDLYEDSQATARHAGQAKPADNTDVKAYAQRRSEEDLQSHRN